MKGFRLCLVLLLAALLPDMAQARPVPSDTICIAPAQPDGGFDLTCRMLAELLDKADVLPQPLQRSFMPGGVGAVAFNSMTGPRAAEPGTLVAFSEGTIYNLAKGSFGDHDTDDVRWLAQVAQDYGAIVLRADAPWPDLSALLQATRDNPHAVAFGGGGSIGGQDWMRAAMIAELAGIDRRRFRFVAFEGSGGCTEALLQGFVQVCMNDVGDTQTGIEAGKPMRMLAVLAPERLLGGLAEVPTAREQGLPLDWPVLRGVYMGPEVSDESFDWWRRQLEIAMASPAYSQILRRYHLQPAPLTGAALEAEITGLTRTARERFLRLGAP
jgi:putative tricarboxylic transport membrane protein